MRSVTVVNKKSGEERTINVGIDWSKIKTRSIRSLGIICSPRIIAHTGSSDETPKSRSWKTTKRGESHAKRGWQRHGSKTRRKYGRTRWVGWPSAKTLNDLGRCIHPCVDLVE